MKMRKQAATVVSGLLVIWILRRFILLFITSTPISSRRFRTSLRALGRSLQQTTAYSVVMHLSLHFVDNELASKFESSDASTNDAVIHFCKAVNEQAGGYQVRSSAQEIGALFETKPPINYPPFSTADYECTILETNRIFDRAAATADKGFFILEVAVEQSVYVTSPVPLSDKQVGDITIQGFNRGRGGRVKFRTYLQLSPFYTNLHTVEVLEGDSLSPLQEWPSTSPSFVPSLSPSASPSIFPTPSPSNPPVQIAKSLVPSRVPSTSPSESFQPTNTSRLALSVSARPSEAPTSLPSLFPSQNTPLPTFDPAIGPTSVSETQGTAADGVEGVDLSLILGAVAGGLGLVLLCIICLVVFCPPIKKRSEETPSNVPGEDEDNEEGVITFVEESNISNQLSSAGGNRSSIDDCSLFTSPESVVDDDIARALELGMESYESSMIMPPSILDIEDDFAFPIAIGKKEKKNVVHPHLDIIKKCPSLETERNSLMENAKASGSLSVLELSDDEAPTPFVDEANSEIFGDFEKDTKGYDPFEVKIDSSGSSDNSDPLEGSTIELSAMGSHPPGLYGKLRVSGSDSDITDFTSQENSSAGGGEDNYKVNNKLLRNVLEEARVIAKEKENVNWTAASLEGSNRSRPSVGDAAPAPPPRDHVTQESAAVDRTDSIFMEGLRQNQPSTDPGGPSLHTEVSETKRVLGADEDLGADEEQQPFSGEKENSKTTTNTGQQAGGRSSPGEDLESSKSQPGMMDGVLQLYSKGTLIGPLGEEEASSTTTPKMQNPAWTKARPEAGNNATVPTRTLEAIPRTKESMHATDTPFGDNPVLTPSDESTPKSVPVFSPNRVLGATKNANKDDSYSDASSDPWLFDYGDPEHHLASAGKRKTADGNRWPGFTRPVASKSKSRRRRASVSSEVEEKISFEGTESELVRLQKQLAAVLHDTETHLAASKTAAARLVVGTGDKNKKQIMVPPGKLGVTLANRHDGEGTVVCEIQPDSVMEGVLTLGDKIVAVNGRDVTSCLVSEITQIMASTSDSYRQVTIIPAPNHPVLSQDENEHKEG